MMTTHERIARLALGIQALKVLRWRWQWPPGHSDAPPTPDWVADFEAAHGPAPASADRVLDRVLGEAGKESFSRWVGVQGPRRTSLSL